MKLELKKFKYAAFLSEETNAFSAELFVDGKRAGYAQNDGHGGNTYIHPFEGTRDLLNAAEAYARSLPSEYVKEYDLTIPSTLDKLVDDLVEEQLKAKDAKKLEKKYQKAVCWGIPGARTYTQVTFKCPLASVPLAQLQAAINRYKAQFKEGETFLNTNLAALGLAI